MNVDIISRQGSEHVSRLASIGGDQIEIAKNYGTVEWHEDLKTCLMQAGVDDKSVVFLFNDTQASRFQEPTLLLWVSY